METKQNNHECLIIYKNEDDGLTEAVFQSESPKTFSKLIATYKILPSFYLYSFDAMYNEVARTNVAQLLWKINTNPENNVDISLEKILSKPKIIIKEEEI